MPDRGPCAIRVDPRQRDEVHPQRGELLLQRDLEAGQASMVDRGLVEHDADVEVGAAARHALPGEHPQPVIGPGPEEIEGEHPVAPAEPSGPIDPVFACNPYAR